MLYYRTKNCNTGSWRRNRRSCRFTNSSGGGRFRSWNITTTVLLIILLLVVKNNNNSNSSFGALSFIIIIPTKKSSTLSLISDNYYERRSQNSYDSYSTIRYATPSTTTTPAVDENLDIDVTSQQQNRGNSKSPLSLSFDELTNCTGGKGRASQIWELLRSGIDPLEQQQKQQHQQQNWNDHNYSHDSKTDTQQQKDYYLGQKLIQRLENLFPAGTTMCNSIGRVIERSVSTDGTTKLLIELVGQQPTSLDDDNESSLSSSLLSKPEKNLCVETVIIPWNERESSTVCISSQVGCRQACTFCRTGRMGKLRDLSTDEILVQVFYAIQEVIMRQQQRARNEVDTTTIPPQVLYPIDNIVFMGMGEPADNADAVVRAANIITDRNQFAISPRRVTISTVAPTPESFHKLGTARALLAWSVHAANDTIRQQLVPTTHYSMVSLRDNGLKPTLLQRSKNSRAVMFEITLLEGINDTPDAARDLANFCDPLLETVPGIKIVVNLIPWNDIAAEFGPASRYKKPSIDRIQDFQRIFLSTAEELMTNDSTKSSKRNLLCIIRTTRGDDESAACGQLATKRL